MGKSTIISVRVPEELKQELRKYYINVNEVVRSALLNEVKKARATKLKKELGKYEIMEKLPPAQDVVSDIREDKGWALRIWFFRCFSNV